MFLPDPLVVRTPGEPEQQQDQNHSLKPWGVQRNFEALAQRFPLSASSENFQQVPQCRAYRSSTQTLGAGGWVALLMDAENYDLGYPASGSAQHDTSTNSDRLVCRVPGLYAVTANVAFAQNTTGSRGLRVKHSGGQVVAIDDRATSNSATDFTQISCAGAYRLAVDEYVYAEAIQSSGGNLNVQPQSTVAATCITFHWVSP